VVLLAHVFHIQYHLLAEAHHAELSASAEHGTSDYCHHALNQDHHHHGSEPHCADDHKLPLIGKPRTGLFVIQISPPNTASVLAPPANYSIGRAVENANPQGESPPDPFPARAPPSA
jgi:hypothetical protein